MRRTCLAALAAIFIGGGANAASISMNEVVLTEGTDLAACKQAGRAALTQIGLRDAGEAPKAVFGEGADGLIAAIYCLPERGIAMIGIAGTKSEATRPVLAALLAVLSPE